jgi:hypothetical protein
MAHWAGLQFCRWRSKTAFALGRWPSFCCSCCNGLGAQVGLALRIPRKGPRQACSILWSTVLHLYAAATSDRSTYSAGEGACAPRFYNLRSSAQICGKKVLGSPITRDHSDCFSSASSFPLRFKGFLGVSVVGFSAILAILT